MNHYKRFFLIGLPGSGKSHLGKVLAQNSAWDFVDTDQRIEDFLGQKITHFFTTHGETAFREVEKKILEECLKTEKTIIATGGGLPCFYDNMDKLLGSGLVVWLNPSIELITERILEEKDIRPHFLTDNKQEIQKKLTNLYTIRFPFYNRAHLHW